MTRMRWLFLMLVLLPGCIHVKAPRPSPTASCPSGPHPSASLCWNWAQGTGAPTDGFRVYRNGLLVATVGAGRTQYMDTAVTSGITYSYTIRAYSAGGESAASNEVRCQIPTGNGGGNPNCGK